MKRKLKANVNNFARQQLIQEITTRQHSKHRDFLMPPEESGTIVETDSFDR